MKIDGVINITEFVKIFTTVVSPFNSETEYDTLASQNEAVSNVFNWFVVGVEILSANQKQRYDPKIKQNSQNFVTQRKTKFYKIWWADRYVYVAKHYNN